MTTTQNGKPRPTAIVSKSEDNQNAFSAQAFCRAGDGGEVDYQNMTDALVKLKRAVRLAQSSPGSTPGKALYKNMSAVVYFPTTDEYIRFSLRDREEAASPEAERVEVNILVDKVLGFLNTMIRFSEFFAFIDRVLQLKGPALYEAVRKIDFNRFDWLKNTSGMWHRGVLRVYPKDQVGYLMAQILQLRQLKQVELYGAVSSDEPRVLEEALAAVMGDKALDPVKAGGVPRDVLVLQEPEELKLDVVTEG